MNIAIQLYLTATGWLDRAGESLPQLGLRLLLAWEFGEAGWEKFNGENWFSHIEDKFPFPFNVVPVDISWQMAMWSELAGAAALVMGLATHFTTASLIVLDLVAWYSVHAGHGYNVCSNGFKLPLIYLILLLPLLFSGPGKASLDHLIKRRWFS